MTSLPGVHPQSKQSNFMVDVPLVMKIIESILDDRFLPADKAKDALAFLERAALQDQSPNKSPPKTEASKMIYKVLAAPPMRDVAFKKDTILHRVTKLFNQSLAMSPERREVTRKS